MDWLLTPLLTTVIQAMNVILNLAIIFKFLR